MDDIKVGNQYFAWTVIALDDGHHYGKVLCRCKCGTVRWVFRSPLRLGKTHSCGCQALKPPIDYGGLKVGDKVGSWTLLERKQDKFYCRCECGRERWVPALRLMRKKSLSCGCKRTDMRPEQMQEAMKKGHDLCSRLGKEKLGAKYAGFGRKKNKNSKTGVTGVSFHKRTGKYRAYIFVERHQLNLGLFDTIAEAAAARREAEKKYFAQRQKRADEIKSREKRMKEKICPLCGKKFRGWHSTKYCDNCRPIAHRLRSARAYQREKLHENDKIGVTVRQCKMCGKKFVISSATQQFCPACRPLHAAEKSRQQKARQWATDKVYRLKKKKYLKEYQKTYQKTYYQKKKERKNG